MMAEKTLRNTNDGEDCPFEVDRLLKALAGQYLRSGLPQEDLVQEGWIGYLKAKTAYPFDPKLETPWHLYVVIVGSWGMLEALRTEARQAAPPDPDAPVDEQRKWLKPRKKRTMLMDQHVTVNDDDDLEQVAAELDMQAVLAVLDDRERRAIELRFWNDLKQSDAAKVMEVSQAAFSKLLNKAMEKLRAELSPKGEKRLDLIPTLKGPKA